MGDNPEQARIALMMQQQQQFANPSPMAVGLQAMGSKKQRELYVGNLGALSEAGMISEALLKELFGQILSSFEGFNAALGPAVLNAQLCAGGNYAFVEFRDEQLCETAMQLNGMDFSGRQLKIAHP